MFFRLALIGFGIVAIAWASMAKELELVPIKKDKDKDVKPPLVKVAGSTDEGMSDPIRAAEKTLADAKIAADPKALLEFFRSRTLADEDRAKLLNTIHRLGDDDFDTREAASEDLMKAGLAALPILRAASRDANVEIARRIDLCLQAINQDQESGRIVAAATLLAHQKVPGTVSTVLNYLPCVPDDEVAADGLRAALIAYTKATGSADPLLLKALDEKDVALRVFAVQVIAEALPAQRTLVRLRLTDPAPKVRYHAARGLAKAGDEEAIPALLRLLTDGPMEYAFQVEDMFCQLLDNGEKPPASLTGDTAGREIVYVAWKKWVEARQQSKTLKLARLNESEPLHGLTLIVEVDGGGINGGRIWECGVDGKQRWEITNLGGPVDVQVLPGDRLLVPEYYSSRCTERDRDGKILWESPKLTGNTVGAQRLPNGNTLIATMTTVVEYTRANEKVAEFTNLGGTVYQAIRHRNGHTFVLANNSVIEFGNDNKQLRTIAVGSLSGWGGFAILPNGNFLIAYYGQGNKYAEVAPDGKIVWEHVTTGAPTRVDPTRIQRLRNGNTLVAGGNAMFVVEYDRDKKELWKVPTKGRPFSVRRY